MVLFVFTISMWHSASSLPISIEDRRWSRGKSGYLALARLVARWPRGEVLLRREYHSSKVDPDGRALHWWVSDYIT